MLHDLKREQENLETKHLSMNFAKKFNFAGTKPAVAPK